MKRLLALASIVVLLTAGASGAAQIGSLVDVSARMEVPIAADTLRVVEPYMSYEQGFRWDYSLWDRDMDNDRVDDLIALVAESGVDALPRMGDGFLPFAATQGPDGPLLDLHIAYAVGVADSDLESLRALGLDSLHIDAMLPSVWAMDATPQQAFEIATFPGVEMVELEQVLRAHNNVARQATQVQSTSTYNESAWDTLNYTGDGIGIAILDTGVDDHHQFLAGRFVAGADSTLGACTVNVDINPDDDNVVSVGLIGIGLATFHGTHVAGTALGHGSTGTAAPGNHAGMAKDADLYDVKVLTAVGASCGNSVRNGLSWIDSFNNGFTLWHNPLHPESVTGTPQIRIANLSLGGACSTGGDSLSQAVDWLVNRGVVVVVAVGNGGFQTNTPQAGCITSPAAAPLAIAVGAYNDKRTVTRADDSVATFSNCGPTHYPSPNSNQKKPDVTAPGVSIVSTAGNLVDTTSSGSTATQALSGTSMATPVVAGIIALMLEKNSTMTPSAIKDTLRSTADYRTDGVGFTIGSDYHSCWGFGQVNAYEAVLATPL